MSAAATLAAAVSGCQPGSESAALKGQAVVAAYECGAQGYMSAELYGAIETAVHWSGADLECDGMARPDNDGARLRFSGDADDGRQIAFIIALPELKRGETGMEYQSNVTLIEEGSGRFFSTANLEVCWTDIDGLESIDDSDAYFAVSGKVFCVAPLIEVNGESDVSIRDLEFRGLLDWNAS